MTDGRIAEARRLVEALRRQEQEELERRHEGRRVALDGVRDALQALGEAPTPAAIVERAPIEFGIRLGFSCVLLSTITDNVLTDIRVWQRMSSTAGVDWSGVAVPLVYPLAERDLLRRGSACMVDVTRSGGRTPAVLQERLGWNAYVAGAVALNGRPRWMLHAQLDAPPTNGGALEVDLLSTYACALGRTIEIAFLRRLLLAHRSEQLRAARSVIDRLESTDPLHAPAEVRLKATSADELTAREQQVIGLMTEGMTNAAIAQRLLISAGTVKYHVANVLSKLGASSRADAVARHMRGA